MAVPTLTTLLSAVNSVLRTINESSVSSLTPPYTDDVGFALDTIREVQVETLSRGYSFNSESDVTLALDVNGKYALPADVIRVTLDHPFACRPNLDLVIRDDAGTLRLYNKAKGAHTFVLPEGLKATIVTLVDYEALPEPFRKYILIRAARTFQARLLGAPASAFSQLEEVHAQKSLRDYEVATYNPSVFGNWSVSRVIRRGYPQTWNMGGSPGMEL